MTVAVREDQIEMAEFLLKEGADVNFVDQDQRSIQNKYHICDTSLIYLKLIVTFGFVAVIDFYL